MIDSGNRLEQRIERLSEKGYITDYCRTFSEAVDKLERTAQEHYALIIFARMGSESPGAGALDTIKRLAPEAQRLLIFDQEELQDLVDEINAANINACMAMPFSDEELSYQVKLRCIEYEAGLKQKRLQKTIQRQNKQLYLIAEMLKKRDKLYAAQLDKKEKEIRILQSRLHSSAGPTDFDALANLKSILFSKKVPLNPKAFMEQLKVLQNRLRQDLEKIAARHKISLNLSSDEAPPVNDLSEYMPVAKQATQLLLNRLAQEQKEIAEAKKSCSEFEDIFKLEVTRDKLEARISFKHHAPQSISVYQVKRFLEKRRIVFGTLEDCEIESWLYDEEMRLQPLLVAKGKPPKPPIDGKVEYFFPVDFLHAGKLRKDGSIDFKDRGQVPHVDKDVLLATKTFPRHGEFGVDIFGETIEVSNPIDPVFTASTGTRLSEDGCQIYSVDSGQPHLDAMGNVSVCREYEIEGDVGFNTGNIDFDGNVIVKGSVNQGFSIRCVSLTAKEICGADVDISGDLNVSMGIIDTELVNVKGSVQAKFIHNSKINAFGDLIVQKEILDSTIYLSGACINKNGSILNSKISAKRGIVASTIGNKTSPASKLTVGIDEYANRLVDKAESILSTNRETIKELSDEIDWLRSEDQDLHAIISRHAHVQDRSQLKINDLEKELELLKEKQDTDALKKLTKTIQMLYDKAKAAENDINKGFRRQDQISFEISQKEEQIKDLEISNENVLVYKQQIMAFTAKQKALPEIKVSRHIEAKTSIVTPNTSKIIEKSMHRCTIREEPRYKDRDHWSNIYKIKIAPY